MSPDSILRLIFSLSLSCRSGSRPGVEHLELSLELSLPLPSKRGLRLPCPLGSFTMAEFLPYRMGTVGVRGQQARPHGGAIKRERCCCIPPREESTAGESDSAPTHWLHTPQLRLSALSTLVPPLLPGSGSRYDSPRPAQQHAPSAPGSSVTAT